MRIRRLCPRHAARASSLVPRRRRRTSKPRRRQPTNPVPSLEPAKTAALWQIARRAAAEAGASAGCVPSRFGPCSMRRPTGFASPPSSLPRDRPAPSTTSRFRRSSRTRRQFRRDQASRIRALGPSFHAHGGDPLHDVEPRWVASTGSSWFTAGVTARERMAAAGYDVTQGDTWALNELTTAVRRGDGNARANVREFLRGLYEGDGERPTRGDRPHRRLRSAHERPHRLPEHASELARGQAFWTDMATYVSDWSQEVYGDLRAHAVPGEAVADPARVPERLPAAPARARQRRPDGDRGGALVPPGCVQPTRERRVAARHGLGLDDGAVDQMSRVHLRAGRRDALLHRHDRAAARSLGVRLGSAQHDRMPAVDFATQTGQLLDRLAAAIRDSAEATDPETSGTGACGPPAPTRSACVDIPGASHNGPGESFRTWTQPLPDHRAAPTAVAAGTASRPARPSR